MTVNPLDDNSRWALRNARFETPPIIAESMRALLRDAYGDDIANAMESMVPPPWGTATVESRCEKAPDGSMKVRFNYGDQEYTYTANPDEVAAKGSAAMYGFVNDVVDKIARRAAAEREAELKREIASVIEEQLRRTLVTLADILNVPDSHMEWIDFERAATEATEAFARFHSERTGRSS